MIKTLLDYLKTDQHKGFVKKPRYFKDGDYLTYFFKEDRCFSKRIDEYLTIYTSVENGELVGIKLKGVIAVIRPETTAKTSGLVE